MAALNERAKTWKRLWGRLFQSVLWLGLSCVVSHGSPHTVSSPFRVDTRTASETASAAFAVDTRPLNGIWTSAESGVIGLDTSGTAPDVSLALVVRDANGQPISDAYIIIQRYDTTFWQGHTGADGSVPLTALPAGNYNVVVIKQGYTSLFQSVPGHAGGPLSLALTMTPAPKLPDLVEVDRTPAETTIRPPEPPDSTLTRPRSFKVFADTSFSQDAPLNPDRMTIVISHGWNLGGRAALSTWATVLAFQIKNHHSLGANAPNIVGWDWSERANEWLPPIDEACLQGEYLGKALLEQLGVGYSQRLHFIGHSLGTIVNAYACDYVHATLPRDRNNPPSHWQRHSTKPHVTIMDEAEITTVFGQNVITASALGWQIAQAKGALLAGTVAAVRDWKSPVPNSAEWTDNYISLVGFQRQDAVNVVLPAAILAYKPSLSPSVAFDRLADVHAYAHLWYRNTIQPAGAVPMVGFGRSFESAPLAFPPSGDGLFPGSVWVENLDTPDILDLVRDPLMEANLKLPKSLSILAASPIGASGIVGQGIMDSYEAGVNWLGDIGGDLIHKTGQVTASVSEKIGNVWDAALDKASSINPNRLFTGSLVVPSLKLLFRATRILPSPSGLSRRSLPTPPQAWLPVQVPENAGFLVFDFTVTGDPADDLIACAINEQNLFTLPARFAPDDSPVSTDFLDISAYAGQEVELYFGLVGGTSDGCTLAIDGIRFVTIPTPKLLVTVGDDQVRLQWPAAAAGWALQRNPGLNEDGWEDITLPETVGVEDGVVTLERPRLPDREFFRLRLVEE